MFSRLICGRTTGAFLLKGSLKYQYPKVKPNYQFNQIRRSMEQAQPSKGILRGFPR
jgi:hypothetical protein